MAKIKMLFCISLLFVMAAFSSGCALLLGAAAGAGGMAVYEDYKEGGIDD